ncbi:MAG: cell division protein FtsA [Patescibacteria group bacterium]|jgi:cell division protein FtsA
MRKGSQNLITGIDIGSSAVRLAVGQFVRRDGSDEELELQILGAVEAPSSGVKNGTINSIDDVVSSVSACLEEAERVVGSPIKSAWVGVSGHNIISQPSRAYVAVSKGDNEITREDVLRVIESSKSVATPLNFEVLHVLPKSFSIDGQSNIKDPIGMTGMRLEVDSQIILGPTPQIKNLTRAIFRTGLEIDGLVLNIIAASDAVLTDQQKEIGVVVVNIGVSTTSLVVFEEGEIIHTAVLKVGSGHVTNDLALGLRTNVDVAEAIKIEFGDCVSSNINRRDEIDLQTLGAPEQEFVRKQMVGEIVEMRMEEILQMIDADLRKINRNGNLPAGAVFIGGGAKIPHLVDLARKKLRLPAMLGYPLDMIGVSDRISDLSFTTAIGLVKNGAMESVTGPANSVMGASRRKAGGWLKKFGQWFKILIP